MGVTGPDFEPSSSIEMSVRVAFGLLLAGSMLLGGCVPARVGQSVPTGSGGSGGQTGATASATPILTPDGPSPTPSFVRPTPTPEPTYFVYVVKSGNSLASIARRFGTSARSIAYWSRATYPSLDPDSAGYRPDYLVVGWRLSLVPNMEVDPENLPDPAPGGPSPDDGSAAPG